MRRKVAIGISIIVSIVFLWLLFTQVSIFEILSALGSIPLVSLIIGILLYAITNILRGVRFHLLLKRGVPVLSAIAIASIHNAFVNILPARSGEFSYIYLLKKHANRGVGTGIGTLALARIFDLLAIVLLFLFATLAVPDLPAEIMQLRIPIVLLASVALLFVILIVFFHKIATKYLLGILKLIRVDTSKLGIWITVKAEEVISSFHFIRSWKLVFLAILLSAGIWLSQFLLAFIIFNAIGISLSFTAIIIVSTVTLLLSAIPIQGVLGFGTSEMYWLIALSGVGIAIPNAISAGFVYHIVTLVYALILGAASLFLLRRKY